MIYLIQNLGEYKYSGEYWVEALTHMGLQYELIGNVKPIKNTRRTILDDVSLKTDQTNQLVSLFKTGKIKDDDVFLFPDAWHPAALYFKYVRSEYNLNCKFIGFWDESFLNSLEFRANRFYAKQGTTWSKQIEKAFLIAYDYNCFHQENLGIRFRVRYFPLMVYHPAYHVPYPFEYIKDDASQIDFDKKEDIILMPHDAQFDDDFLNVVQDASGYKLINASSLNLSRDSYLEVLAKSKIFFIPPGIRHRNLTQIWEAMQYGAVPLIPKTHVNTRYGRRQYIYEEKIFEKNKNVLKFLRKSQHFIKLLLDVKDNYGEYKNLINQDLLALDIFYKNNAFLELCSGNSNSVHMIASRGTIGINKRNQNV